MDKEIISRFEKEIKIDINQLHTECQNHADLYGIYTGILAAIKSTRDEIKNDLIALSAQTELFYRSDKFDYKEIGLTKITEGTIAALLNSNEDLIEKRKELLQIESDFNSLLSMATSMEQRGKQLNNLTTLWESKYPPFHNGVTGMTKEEIDKAQDEVRKNINKKGD